MESTTWSNLIAGAALAISIGGSLWNRAEARGAGEKAERATQAAERAAAAEERMARALELQAISAARAAPEPEVAWQLSHHSGDTYLLENVGTATAHQVEVNEGEGMIFRGPNPDQCSEIPAGQGLTFLAGLTYGTKDDRVTVTWADSHSQSATRHEWKRPLPRRPR